MPYDQRLATADDIAVQTYYKSKCSMGCRFGNITVASINVGAGTVNAKLGDNNTYKDYPKNEVFRLINFCCYSNTEC